MNPHIYINCFIIIINYKILNILINRILIIDVCVLTNTIGNIKGFVKFIQKENKNIIISQSW
jgi:hypothetical protein